MESLHIALTDTKISNLEITGRYVGVMLYEEHLQETLVNETILQERVHKTHTLEAQQSDAVLDVDQTSLATVRRQGVKSQKSSARLGATLAVNSKTLRRVVLLLNSSDEVDKL